MVVEKGVAWGVYPLDIYVICGLNTSLLKTFIWEQYVRLEIRAERTHFRHGVDLNKFIGEAYNKGKEYLTKEGITYVIKQ